MMSVFVVVMSMCTASEGCLDEQKPTTYASRAECLETMATMPVSRGVKYRCAATPQFMVSEARKATRTHLVTTASEAPIKP
ncbi:MULTISPECIES: hypothetical protein [Pseudomonas]|uniref:Secreted protein n=1 Tax=Pseudomonas quercus TaxID=2722792 RepID=A0ABX0YBH3_9PSED|nr:MULTISPECIES: hypothetical protein [Pseudomonas]MBF7141218.1 hypothetical protein [Pseudomonas sp. LY10J]NJO99753.1 hypothetical protein [Pseudomonas quercus]